jgi:hypothetical protein
MHPCQNKACKWCVVVRVGVWQWRGSGTDGCFLLHLPRMRPHASLRCLLCSEWVECAASCRVASSRFLSLPLLALASSPFSRFLSLLLVLSPPLLTLIRPHARTDAALASYSRTPMHTHRCTHTPGSLPAVSHAHCIAILPLLPSFFVFVFVFPLLWAAAGCGVVASHSSCLLLCLLSSQYTTSSPEHLEPPAPLLTSLLL